jgi:hypothetical protein
MVQQGLRNLVRNASNYLGLSGSSVLDTQQGIEEIPSTLISIGKVYYLHLRNYNVPDRHKCHLDYCPRLSPLGGATIAYRLTDGEDECFFLEMGVAHCRYDDNFCKRIGRDIALARLLDDDAVEIAKAYASRPTLREVIAEVKEAYYTSKEEAMPTVRLVYR